MKVREAVEKAVTALKDAFFDEEFHDLKLEEVELGDDGNAWYITLGFDRSVDLTSISAALGTKWKRIYKVVKLNSETGEAEFIKMRESVE